MGIYYATSGALGAVKWPIWLVILGPSSYLGRLHPARRTLPMHPTIPIAVLLKCFNFTPHTWSCVGGVQLGLPHAAGIPAAPEPAAIATAHITKQAVLFECYHLMQPA